VLIKLFNGVVSISAMNTINDQKMCAGMNFDFESNLLNIE